MPLTLFTVRAALRQAVNADGFVRKPASSEELLAVVDPGRDAASLG